VPRLRNSIHAVREQRKSGVGQTTQNDGLPHGAARQRPKGTGDKIPGATRERRLEKPTLQGVLGMSSSLEVKVFYST